MEQITLNTISYMLGLELNKPLKSYKIFMITFQQILTLLEIMLGIPCIWKITLPLALKIGKIGLKCRFGNFSILPKWYFWTRAWNSKISSAKRLFWSIMKAPYPTNIRNMSEGLQNPGFKSVKSHTVDFLKKDLQHFKNSFQFGFLWSLSKPGKQNFKRCPFFWYSQL